MILLLYSSIYPLAIIVAGFVLCCVLHWLIGRLQKRLIAMLEAHAAATTAETCRPVCARLAHSQGFSAATALARMPWGP